MYSIPICQEDINYDITFDITSDETVENVFLFTTSDYVGAISAKLSSQTSYRLISEYSSSPAVFLGDMTADVSHSVDFRINISSVSSLLGKQFIPISVMSSPFVSPFYFVGDNPFLIEDTTDDPTFYFGSSEECDDGWLADGY